MRKTGWTGVTNSTAEAIPPFGLMKPSGPVDEFGNLPVEKPDTDSEEGLFVNGPVTIPAGQRGAGTLDAEVILSYTGPDPAIGTNLGSIAGSWNATAGQQGFKTLTAGADGVCNAVRVAPSAGVNAGTDNGNWGLTGGDNLEWHFTPTQLTNTRYVVVYADTTATVTDDVGTTFTENGPQCYVPAGSGLVQVHGRITCRLTYGADLVTSFGSTTVFNVYVFALLIHVDEDGVPEVWTDADGNLSDDFPSDPTGGTARDGRLTEDMGPVLRATKYTGSTNVFGDLDVTGWSGEIGGPIKVFNVGSQPLRLAWAVCVRGNTSASGLSSSGHAWTLKVPVSNNGVAGNNSGQGMITALPYRSTSFPLPP